MTIKISRMKNFRTVIPWCILLFSLPVGAAVPPEWAPHAVRRGDGRGGWVDCPARYRFLRHPGGVYTYPFGLAAMDNGELMLIASWNDGTSADARKREHPFVAFSRDDGETWTDFNLVPNSIGRPMALTDLGHGRLFFFTDPLKPVLPTQHFTADYGRTWPEWRVLQPAANGGTANGVAPLGFFGAEGNALVLPGPDGNAAQVVLIGWNFPVGSPWPQRPASVNGGILRWSRDGGRSWTGEHAPKAWQFEEKYKGKTYLRGVNEGSLVRAANGWLVAALRTDLPMRFMDGGNEDSLEGTGYSLSRDDGRTWSPVRVLFEAGRHHAHLLKLPNGDLLMTLIVRDDIRNGAMRRASNLQGCEAILSHDNGLTWDLEHKYIVDSFEYDNPAKWYQGMCGHLSSCLLRDGSILTAYGNYVQQGVVLVRWRPASD